MGVFANGRNAGGWKGQATAGVDLIPTLLENEKDFAVRNDKTFVIDGFHIIDICIEAPAGSTFSINGGTTITMPESGMYHNASSVIKTLIFDSAADINIAYCY